MPKRKPEGAGQRVSLRVRDVILILRSRLPMMRHELLESQLARLLIGPIAAARSMFTVKNEGAKGPEALLTFFLYLGIRHVLESGQHLDMFPLCE